MEARLQKSTLRCYTPVPQGQHVAILQLQALASVLWAQRNPVDVRIQAVALTAQQYLAGTAKPADLRDAANKLAEAADGFKATAAQLTEVVQLLTSIEEQCYVASEHRDS